MSIEVKENSKPPSHEENLFFQVVCYSCPRVSEEDGDILPGPDYLADIGDNFNRVQAKSLAEAHDFKYAGKHNIVVRYFDIPKIRKTLE
jgi:hypothetical protein